MFEDIIEVLGAQICSAKLQIERLTKPVKIGENRYIFPFIDEYRRNLIIRLGNEIAKRQKLLELLKIRFNS